MVQTQRHRGKVMEPFKLDCSEDDRAVFISSGLLITFSSEHEMKLDDPVTTKSCHTINTKRWDCAGVHWALIYQLVTEVRASEQARDKCREEWLSHKNVAQEIV